MSFWYPTTKDTSVEPESAPQSTQNSKIALYQAEAKKAQQEANKANSFWGLTKNTILGLPKASKDLFYSPRGYSEEELAKEPSFLQQSPKEKVKAVGRLGAEIFWGLGSLGSKGLDAISQKNGKERLIDKIARTKTGGQLTDVSNKVGDYAIPKTPREAQAMRQIDVLSNFVPGVGSVKNVSKAEKALQVLIAEGKARVVQRAGKNVVEVNSGNVWKTVTDADSAVKELTPKNSSSFITPPIRKLSDKDRPILDRVNSVIKGNTSQETIADLPDFVSSDGIARPLVFSKAIADKVKQTHGALVPENLVLNANEWDYALKNVDGNKDKINLIKEIPNSDNFLTIAANRSNGFYMVTHYEYKSKNGQELKNLLKNKGDALDRFGRTPESTTPYPKGLADSVGSSPEAITVFKPDNNIIARPIIKNQAETTPPLGKSRPAQNLSNQSVEPRKAPTQPVRELEPKKLSQPLKPPVISSSLPNSTTAQGKKLGSLNKLVTSGRRILQESGPSGKKMAQIMDNQRVKEDLLTGNYNVRIKKALDGLTKKERFNLTDVLEGGKPINNIVAKRASDLRSWLDEVATKAEKEGFEMKTGGGGTVPFKKRDNYFPRKYNFDDLAKGKKRDQALEHLVKTGQARNLAEAESLLQTMIDNAQRRAGNLENPRMLDLPGYEKDPSVALPNYAQSVAKRFTEAEHFGKKDEKIAELVKQITNEKGDYKEAQRIFDFTVDGAPKNKLVSTISQLNVVTKLSLSAITNATQTLNTMTKAGILTTFKGIWKGFTKEGKELAELVNAYDDFILVKEGGFDPSKIVKGVMYIFKKVENFNRRTAANTGVLRQKQLVDMLKKNPESGYAIRQLESLGIDTQKALQGKLTDDDILTAANKMIEKTQFKVDPLDVPPSWKTPLGRLLTQFKSFSFMQTKFVRDEIIKEARHGNFAPLATFITLAVPASLLVHQVRNKLTGREDENIDIRDWDKWMKAFGTIPTDLLTQADFLRDTFKADYITPLEKSSRVAGTILGPTAGEAGKLVSGVEQVGRIKDKNKFFHQKKDPYLSLKRQGVEKIPFVGQYLKNKFFGYPKSNKTPEEKELDNKIYAQKDAEEKANYEAKQKIQPIYDKAQQLITEGRQDEADKLVNDMTEEDYEVYKKIRTAERSKNTERVRDLLAVDPIEAVKFVRTQNQKEQDRIINLLTDEEYKLYESGKPNE